MANRVGKQSWYFDWDSMSWKSNDYFHDTLVGTSDDDTISGLGGNDTLWGGTGDDKMYGGADNDTIKPGDPTIDITWNWGQDYAYGGDGIDTRLPQDDRRCPPLW
jgi:RTX calcium-binding nonapeptide repeat (4 copies)